MKIIYFWEQNEEKFHAVDFFYYLFDDFKIKVALINIWEIGPSSFWRTIFIWTLILPWNKWGFYFSILIFSMECHSSIDNSFQNSYFTSK